MKLKNVWIGLGGLAAAVLLIVLGQTGRVPALGQKYVFLALMAVGMFFFGFIFGGWKPALILGGGITAYIVVLLLPESIRGLGALVFLAGIALFSNFGKVKGFIQNRLKPGQAGGEQPREGKELPDHTDASPELVDMPEIYLIKPYGFKLDSVFKVFRRGDSLYFCRVGGQLYGIDDRAGYGAQMPAEELLKDRHNFAVSLSQITSLFMNPRPSHWTGHIENNGTVLLARGGKKDKYIVHPVQSFESVELFFRKYCTMQPEVKANRAQAEEPEEPVHDVPAPKGSAKIKKVVKYMGWASLPLAIWLMLFPVPYELVVALNLLMPLVGFVIYIRYGKQIRLKSKQKKDMADLATILLMPSLALMVRALMDFNILFSTNFWLYCAGLAAALSLLIFLLTEEYKRVKSLIVLLPLLFCLYSFGAVATTNCVFDFSKPEKFRAEVLDKRVSSGKTTTYHLTLGPWGGFGQAEASVSHDQYDQAAIGQYADVYVWGGLWGIRWYEPYVEE